MATIKNILVPVDFSKGSQAALNRAIDLARDLRAKLLLVHVITTPAANVPLQFQKQYKKEVEEEAVESIERLLGRKKVKADTYRVVILHGKNAAQLITEQAAKSRCSMIVMGSHGRTGLRRLFLGSVAEKTIRYAPCPILIVKK
jgi:universal stress protein A